MGELDELIRRRDELLAKIKRIILDAIKTQRWFWFEGKPKILFDRDTALLWADLN